MKQRKLKEKSKQIKTKKITSNKNKTEKTKKEIKNRFRNLLEGSQNRAGIFQKVHKTICSQPAQSIDLVSVRCAIGRLFAAKCGKQNFRAHTHGVLIGFVRCLQHATGCCEGQGRGRQSKQPDGLAKGRFKGAGQGVEAWFVRGAAACEICLKKKKSGSGRLCSVSEHENSCAYWMKILEKRKEQGRQQRWPRVLFIVELIVYIELVATRAQGYEGLLLGILCFVHGLETAWQQ